MNKLVEDSGFYCTRGRGPWNEKVLKMMVIVLGLKSGALRDCR